MKVYDMLVNLSKGFGRNQGHTLAAVVGQQKVKELGVSRNPLVVVMNESDAEIVRGYGGTAITLAKLLNKLEMGERMTDSASFEILRMGGSKLLLDSRQPLVFDAKVVAFIARDALKHIDAPAQSMEATNVGANVGATIGAIVCAVLVGLYGLIVACILNHVLP